MIKVANLNISQDNCGLYVIRLKGTDAAFFRVINNELWFILQQPNIDKTSYTVIVSVEDLAGRFTPLTRTFTLNTSNCATSTTSTTSTTVPVSVTTTTTTTLAPKGQNSANFNRCADWNGQDGNVTTVGSNGGPSAYGTYDQSGNVFEYIEDNVLRIKGGSFNMGSFELSSLFIGIGGVGNFGNAYSDVGFRIASTNNPLSFPNFVKVNDPDNISDTNGYGSVSYTYYISKYPVTNYEYLDFLNAMAKSNNFFLYSSLMIESVGFSKAAGILQNGGNGSYSYTLKANMGNKPVIYVSLLSAFRYCNWLHNGKPIININDSTTTEDGAYTLNGAGYNTTSYYGRIITANPGALYRLPTPSEWHKAAYYTPRKNGYGPGYWKYATQYDEIPICVKSNSAGDGPVLQT